MYFKESLKKVIAWPPIYDSMVHVIGARQKKQILAEEKKYNTIASEKKIDAKYDFNIIFKELVLRLAARGIKWPPKPEMRPLHILYASIPGNWERHNIPPQLEKIGDVTCYFTEERGISIKNRAVARPKIDCDFVDFVKELHKKKPIDMLLSYFSGAEISPDSIEAIKSLGIATFSFHWDDRPSFFGRQINGQWSGPVSVCSNYDLNLTNSPESLVKYTLSSALVAFWPEASNPDHFAPKKLNFKHDVSFVGAKYGVREKFIKYLKKNGIDVVSFGPGWESKKLTESGMVDLYNSSRINLGFGYILFTDQVCLKGRDFEVPSCGAVYLTTYNKHLESMYTLDKDIVTYKSKEECLEKIKWLLDNPDLCSKIRESSRATVLSKHTWEKRIRELFYGKNQV